MSAIRIAPDGMPHFAASHLGLFCLPMSHKKDTRLIWVNAKKSKLVYNTFQQRNPVNFLFHVYVNIFLLAFNIIYHIQEDGISSLYRNKI